METEDGYRAARDTAAVFDRSARGKIAVAGHDRRTYLHAMLTNDVATLQAGDASGDHDLARWMQAQGAPGA